MPVSYVPDVVTFLIIAALVYGSLGGWSRFRWALLGVLVVVGALVGPIYQRGIQLCRLAKSGDARAQYRYARWLENTPEEIGSRILWPTGPDVMGGYAWLERSAAAGYPPAIYLLGVRLKYGEFVPEPKGWKGPGGNVFPQPERGQKLIDQAARAGFHRPASGDYTYYFTVYRNSALDDIDD
jgi:TPR repeat protein